MKANILSYWIPLLSIALSIGFPIAIFSLRNWIATWIAKSVQHGFDVKLETLRAQLQTNEEQFKSDLRKKEVELEVLRSNVYNR
jgi:hypothetical protein